MPVGTRRMLYLPSFSTLISRWEPIASLCTTMVSPATASPMMLPDACWALALAAKPNAIAMAHAERFKVLLMAEVMSALELSGCGIVLLAHVSHRRGKKHAAILGNRRGGELCRRSSRPMARLQPFVA